MTSISEGQSAISEWIGELQLIVATILFGIAFVGQRYAMTSTISAITFNTVRFSIAYVFLLLANPLLRKYSPAQEFTEKSTGQQDYINRNGGSYGLFVWSMITGGSNFFGSWLTQNALVSLTAGKAGFISGTYVVIIPFIEWLLPACFGYPIQCLNIRIWIGAALCVLGTYFISGCSSADSHCLSGDQFVGEIYGFCAVIFWAINIMSIGLAVHQVDSVELLYGQTLTVVVMSGFTAILTEPQEWQYPYSDIRSCLLVSLAVGMLNVTAYFISILGQQVVRPSRAAILFSSGESLTACIGGYFILGEMLTEVELIGGLLMVLSACIAATADIDDEDDGVDVDLATNPCTEDSLDSDRGAGAGINMNEEKTQITSIIELVKTPATLISSNGNVNNNNNNNNSYGSV